MIYNDILLYSYISPSFNFHQRTLFFEQRTITTKDYNWQMYTEKGMSECTDLNGRFRSQYFPEDLRIFMEDMEEIRL